MSITALEGHYRILVAIYNPQADEMLENEKMLASLPLINTGQDYIGWMKPEVWEGMAATLQQYGALPTSVTTDELYTLKFLQEIYQHDMAI